jgi:cell volume regulation protein A
MAGGKTDSRVARILEVESCVTDALCVVVTIVMINIVIQGVFDLGYPLLALAQAAGVGVTLGVAGAAIFIPLLPKMRGRVHAYTVLLAGFLIVYGLVQMAGGNGALGVLTCALLVGNAPDLLPRLNFRVRTDEFGSDQTAMIIHNQFGFFIKSFFFFLIGLMFPTSPQQILVGAGAAVVLLIARIPAVRFALWGTPFTPAQQGIMIVAIPRGLAAGVLSTMPMYMGVPNSETLVPMVFSTIVFSIIIFSGGIALLGRAAKG